MIENESISPELVQRYPWLPSLKRIYYDISNQDPLEFTKNLLNQENLELVDRLLDFFMATFNNVEYIKNYKFDETNIDLYILLRIILFVLNIDPITNRIANLYSKIQYNELINENDFNLYKIFQDLDLDVKYYQIPIQYRIKKVKDQTEILKTNYRIHYVDYLKLSSKLRDEYRKLINVPISEGYVFISKRGLVRLLQEYIREKFLEIKERDNESAESLKSQLKTVDEFNKIYNRIKDEWDLIKEEFDYSINLDLIKGENVSDLFPPCVKNILTEAREGQNLSHNERLFLTFFLHSLEYPVEKIVNIFSTLPDFDREKTTYQVEFAKKKGYTPHSCQTLKSLNLCKAVKYKDDLCLNGYYSKKLEEEKKIRHPLFYVQFQQYRVSKQDNEES
ncbi:MAG: DNA primase large subunit PriL [Promethearchaeota archaeon]|nr:MAG: DNA primase large subunit PriL [Candidatus Lokiarchaeota archaeon]